MPDDLLGPRAAIAHYRTVTTPPRKKRLTPLKPRLVVLDDAVAARHRAQWAADYRAWALEELERWKARLPAAEYEKQRARLESL